MRQRKHLLLALVLFLVALPLAAQTGTVTLSFDDEPLPSAFKKLEKASDYKISFAYADVEKYRVSGQVKNKPFEAALQFLLGGKPLSYEIKGKFVDIKAGKPSPTRKNRDISGIVRDEFGEPLPGATVTSTGGNGSREISAVVTDMNGHFKLTVAGDARQLEVSYVGFETKKVALTAENSYDISLQPDSKAIDEVVVTGVFTRKANTFTGAVTTIKGDDLKRVGNANILQSLKNIDPSFMQVENLGMGSDPNSLPDFQMRGASTISGVQGEYASSANQPLFILDGFETELTKIMDLDMNQVESVTTLKDATGNYIRAYNYTDNNGESAQYSNPLYNTTLNTIDNNTYTNITNDFYMEWQIMESLKMTGRFGIVRKTTTADIFKPANHTDFVNTTDEFRRGSYSQSNGKHTDISADLGLQWSKQIDKHLVFLNGQLSMSDNSYNTVGIMAEGFPNDFMDDISFAVQYAKDSKPTGTEGISRNCGGLLSVNYSFDERYLFDANYRLMGSSEAGAKNRWGSFWSVGGGWNAHNEKFLKSAKWINRLKLRASYGYTGSQGFSSYDALPTFVYFSNLSYNGYIGSYVKGLANEYLRWQEKYDTNVGVDFNLFNNRLSGRFDYYIATTKGMVTNVTVPYTTGFTTYVDNLGETENKGFEAYLNYKVFDGGRDYVNVFGSVAHNKNKLKKISNSLRAWNEAKDKDMIANETTAPSVKYYEGCSMTAIWAVPSLGIDPQNGKEIFVKKDGTVTYDYDIADQVVCGDTQPKFNGNFGINGEINGWGWNVTVNYKWGGQIYNQTLVDKVENAQLQYNVDRRVLTDRWQKPGDVALYKAIGDQSVTYPTSRFVQDYNTFTLSSLTLYYDFRNCRWVKDSFLERLKVSAYTNDLFVISSVKTERGTTYPYARSFSLSAQVTF